MVSEQLDEEAIFQTARRIDSSDARMEYLGKACGGDQGLLDRVMTLLRTFAENESFLESPPPGIEATVGLNAVSEGPGTVIGPYKLLQQIGEGGMGVVFMAEQTEPIQRTVALKIIKPGMDTRQVIARFEAERQAVAMMDHPNIAKVLDAGTTDTGRPYFVMELVKGVPVTRYCDEKQLSLRQRLELFKPVCEAVQHAHQKGIIHRDLKPTNVLVAEYDNRAVPKIIDFGVSKATAQKLTERTMFTEFGQVIGTVEYMSPEQAKFNQLDIDTRSDIYSLGVLLYELLSGSPPFEQKRLREVAFDEVLRIIREEEPPKPSTRLSTSETLASIAANRHTEPARLSKEVSGELDWIVMKCLEKDRNRRYETATGLGRDIDRYLSDDAVQAGPPSALYRFRKFARRNKVAMFAAAAAVMVLLLGVTGLAISNRMIAAQRQRAEQNFVQARVSVSKILSQAAMGVGDWAKLTPELRKKFANEAISFYESFLREESTEPSLQYETGVAYRALSELHRSIGEMQPAEKFARQSIDILDKVSSTHPDVLDYRQQLAYSHYTLGQLLRQIKRPAEAEPEFKQAAVLYEALISQRPDVADYFKELAPCYGFLAFLQKGRGDSHNVEVTIQRLLDLPSKIPTGNGNAADIQSSIGLALKDASRFKEAIVVYKEVIRLRPEDSKAHFYLGYSLFNVGQFEEAIQAYKAAIRLHPTPNTHQALGSALLKVGQIDEAIVSYRKAIELDPKNSSYHLGLGNCLQKQHKHDESAAAYRKAIELDPKNSGAYNNLGNDLDHQQKFVEAAAAYRKAIELDPKLFVAYINLGILFTKQGRLDEAVEASRKAIALAPNDPDPYLSLGNALFKQGKLEEAVAALQKTVELQPSSSAYGTLGDVLLKQGKREDTLAAYRKAVELQPNLTSQEGEASDWFSLAKAHWQLGNKKESKDWYEKAAKWMETNSPDDPILRQSRAEAAELLGIAETKPESKSAPPTEESAKADKSTDSTPTSPPPTDN